MALSTATITFNVEDMTGVKFDARRTKVWLTTNVENDTVIDKGAKKIRLGSGDIKINEDGTGSATVWIPGPDANPRTWQTTFHVDYPDRHRREQRVQRHFGPFTITGNADLANLVDEQAVPPTYITQVTQQLDAKVAQATSAANNAATTAATAAAAAVAAEVAGETAAAQAARVAAESAAARARDISDIDSTDDAVDVALKLPGGKARATLSASIASGVEESAYATPAVQAFLQKIKLGQQDAYWTHVGDSIDASADLWVARLADYLAEQFPTHTVKFRIWTSGTNTWSGWSTRSTGSGSRTIWVSNGAVGGSSTAYAAARMAPMVWSTTPDLLTYAYNANEFPHTAAGAATYVSRFLTFTEDALRGCDAQIVYVAKPPRPADPGATEMRVDAARAAVRAKGFGWIDFMQAFRDTPNYAAALYLPESIVVHPNAAGQELMLSIAKRHFTYRPGVTGGAQSPSSFTPPLANLIPNGFFTDWTGDVPAGFVHNTNATCTKDTTNFETGTYGLRITPTDPGVASVKLEADVPIARFRGQYVTLAARVLCPWGTANIAGLGRLGIASSGAGFTQAGSAEIPAGAGFQWRAVTLRVPDAATNARIVLEARATFTGAGDWAVYDRVILAPGILPRDAIPGLTF